MVRRKSRLEALFSLSRYQKRWGAARHTKAIDDFGPLKTSLVEPSDGKAKTGHIKAIDDHLANLRVEFQGRPEILYHHAMLIVLIRREYKVEETYARFRTLWEQEADFLCENLNLRWLISATDTFADHDPDMAARAIAMMVSVFATTIKIYETERFVSGSDALPALPEKIEQLQPAQVPLFEGMCLFRVGSDDTLRNMRWRLEPFFKHGATGRIAATVYDRMQDNDTAYARFRALHHRDRTGWW
ncbi:MAG: hypothetical protein JWM58_3089 [Rhizobium sp.]|nr:hypothetical protein [Rhizobium sp.]